MEIKTGRELGYHSNYKYGLRPCLDCGKEQWIALRHGKPVSLRCYSCANRVKNPPKDRKTIGGYFSRRLQPNDFFYPTACKKGDILIHRLVMAQHLGRNLQKWEIVHHKNGDKQDNRIENLELISSISDHMSGHLRGYQDGYTKGLNDGRDEQMAEIKSQNDELLKQIKLLQWQVKEYQDVSIH